MSDTMEEWLLNLEPYRDWALPTSDERASKRRTSTPEELQRVYDGVTPYLKAILTDADRYPLGQLPTEKAWVFNLALMVAEVAPHVELYGGSPAVPHSFDETRFEARQGGDITYMGRH